MNKIILFLFFYFIKTIGFCQSTIQWQKDIGGTGDDFLNASIQTSDGGYLVGGWSDSNISGDKTQNCYGGKDFWVLKLNSIGNILWQKTIGGTGDDEIWSILQTPDKGFLLAGTSDSPISGDKTQISRGSVDYWLVKIDSLGNVLWDKTYGGGGGDILITMISLNAGGYVLSGHSKSTIGGDKTQNLKSSTDTWIIKIDNLGNIIWQKDYGGTWNSNSFSNIIKETSDKGFIIQTSTDSNIGNDKSQNSKGGSDCWVIKTDSLGVIQWDKTIGGSGSDGGFSIHEVLSGGYIICGSSDSNISGDKSQNSKGGSDFWIVRLNGSGNVVWDKTIGGSGLDFGGMSRTADGGYLIGGLSTSPISGDKTQPNQGLNDYWIIKVDSLMNILWQSDFGGSATDLMTSGTETSDGGFLLAGYSDSNISGDKNQASKGWSDFWIIKIAKPLDVNKENLNDLILKVYPNPSSTHLIIESAFENADIEITNSIGQTILKTPYSNSIDISKLESGYYNLKIVSESGKTYRNKFIKQ